jgi:hypothetical protein
MSEFTHSVGWFYKYPNDKFDIKYDFDEDIASADSISSMTATPFDSDGDTVSGMISNVTASTPNTGLFTIEGGTDGETYSIKLVCTTTQSKKFTHYLTCEVYGALTLNSKLGDKDCNSYVIVKEANDYIRNKYGHDNKWDTLSDEGKKRILVEAAQELEAFNYIGEKYYDSQGLEFPRDDHAIITGNCATPITTTSFRNSNLYSDTYGKYPTDYWKYGSVHITEATPVNETRRITNSHVTNGSITVTPAFSTTPTTNSQFIVFTPLHQEIKNAQIEQALYIVQNANIETLQTYKDLGARRIEIGDTAVWFQEGISPKAAISPLARRFLGRWLRRQVRIGRA